MTDDTAMEDGHQRPVDARDGVSCSDEIDENALIYDFPDEVLERAAGSACDQALTMGFCTFNLIECPIGSPR